MKVIIVWPGMPAKEAEIRDTDEMRSLFNCQNLELQDYWQDGTLFISAEDAGCQNEALNRAFIAEDDRYEGISKGEVFGGIIGPFVICGEGDPPTDIPEALVKRYIEMFREPDLFIREGNEVLVYRGRKVVARIRDAG